MIPVTAGHDNAATGLMGLMISDVAIRQPRRRGAALAVRVTENATVEVNVVVPHGDGGAPDL